MQMSATIHTENGAIVRLEHGGASMGSMWIEHPAQISSVVVVVVVT